MINRQTIDVSEDEILLLDRDLLKILLKDRTTQKNIIWASDDYLVFGECYSKAHEITVESITGSHVKLIQPRIEKVKAHQENRTKTRAEVFTPSWVCNEQNNLVDSKWFGRENVFNTSNGHSWITKRERIAFPNDQNRSWKQYVDAKRLEITCGEAPYIVSRYDTVTGYMIPLMDRIGLLDRKLRVVSENAQDDEEWLKWAERAVQSIYGYEFQGDNLLLARENVLLSYMDYFTNWFKREPQYDDVSNIALIVSWNLWQMDGLNYAIPFCGDQPNMQMSFFDIIPEDDAFSYLGLTDPKGQELCKIKDWRAKETIEFRSLVKGTLL